MRFNNKKFLIFFLILLILLSFSYNLWTLFDKLKNKYWWAGYFTSIENILKEAEKPGCAPFEVFKAEKRVKLINLNCLMENSYSPQQKNREEGLNQEKGEKNP